MIRLLTSSSGPLSKQEKKKKLQSASWVKNKMEGKVKVDFVCISQDI